MKFLSPWRHNKALFLISLPQTSEFLSCKDKIQSCIEKLMQRDVVCHEEISPTLLAKANKYEYVIVVAHKDEKRDALALANGFMSIDEFVNSFPTNFNGTLDFSSCHSASAMKKIKERCPNCHVLTSIGQTTLPLRLFMYPYIFDMLYEDKSMTYHDAYQEVLQAIADNISHNSTAQHSVKLGKQQSTIYAPSAVKRQKPFLVQLFFHNDTDTGSVDIQAKRFDPETQKVETQDLPLKLKMKDRISVCLKFVSHDKNLIQLEDDIDTKNIVWLGQTTKVQFCVTVDKDFHYDSFVGKLMIEINCVPIGECYFNIKVAEEEYVAPTDIKLVRHNFEEEQKAARKASLTHFKDSLSKINEKISKASDATELRRLEHIKQVCSNCINIIENGVRTNINPVKKKVFVCSTSDMKPYRDIVRQEIEVCGMYPEMYENWPQSAATPRDECCMRVIESDILLCILGSRYGFVDEEMDTSMTEIEYRTALGAGKTILVYIIEPLNKTDEPPHLAERQKKLIEEIRDTRILKFFSDEETLAKDTVRNLSLL